MTTPALLCRQLIKTFDGMRALDGLRVVGEPEQSSDLGPNGSGKTTTIRTPAGIYKPDGGSVQQLGSSDPLAVRRQTTCRKSGDSTQMKPHEQLAFLASIRGSAAGPRVAPRWLDRVGLGRAGRFSASCRRQPAE
jgi:ABC-type multidrug transport system ATPase subunit